jgi:hypothetical protein
MLRILSLSTLLLSLLLLLSSPTSTHSSKPFSYTPIEAELHSKRCSDHCTEGGCKFSSCDADHATSCDGGLCEYIDSTNASCNGGACVFIGCKGSQCRGGGCHHVNPLDTLKDEYCVGGGCKLNGQKIPAVIRGRLTT